MEIIGQAENGRQAWDLIQKQVPDIILTDINMPQLNGIQLASLVRETYPQVHLVFLTGYDDFDYALSAVKLGVDDYLLKPFDFAELLARIRTLLRRNRTQTSGTHRIADLVMDVTRRSVSRSGKKIHLSAKEFVLLELLLQRTGEVLPRSLLSSLVWNINFESDTNVIDVAVRRLRSKVDDDFTPKLIHTVRGIGYVLEIREE